MYNNRIRREGKFKKINVSQEICRNWGIFHDVLIILIVFGCIVVSYIAALVWMM